VVPRDDEDIGTIPKTQLLLGYAVLYRHQGVRSQIEKPAAPEIAFDFYVKDPTFDMESMIALDSSPAYGVIIQNQTEPNMVQLYYRCHQYSKEQEPFRKMGHQEFEIHRKRDFYTCLLESTDRGKTFKRPNLQQIEFRGSKTNHIVFDGGGSRWNRAPADNFAPFVDDNPNCKDGERYKGIGGTESIVTDSTGGTDNGVFMYSSPDGRKWKPMSDKPLLTRSLIRYNSYPSSFYDSHNIMWWDETCECYRIMSRANTDRGGRGMGMHTSYDLQTASEQTVSTLQYKDAPGICVQRNIGKDEQFYTQNPFKLRHVPHILFADPMRCSSVTTVCNVPLLYSLDNGVSWGRVGDDFAPFLEPVLAAEFLDGTEHGSGLRYFQAAANTIRDPKTGDTSFVFFDGFGTSRVRVMRSTAKKDRFAGMNADANGGWFTSRVMESKKGESLYINHRNRGHISVELRSVKTNEPIGHWTHTNFKFITAPESTDATDTLLKWVNDGNEESEILPEGRFRVDVRLADATVFALQVAPSGATLS